MGKKKGGAKNKLARMSEEERARYLQHRADMEEEARRRKQQLIALYMKNKLKREEAFSRLNLAKINQEWRSILRQIKCQELKNEVIEVERLFGQSLEGKGRIIRRLLSDLDECEELYSNLSQACMENVDNIIDLQDARNDFFKDRYIEEKEIILKECKDDFKEYRDARNKSQLQLECVYFAFDDIGDKEIKELDDNHMKIMDDLKSSIAIKLEKITKSREEYLQLLWKEYQQTLNDYVKHTEDFYSEYSELRERDEINTRLIRSHCFEVARATDQLADLKIISDNTTEESDFQIKYLEKYRHSLNDKYMTMKKDLEDQIRFDEDEFRLLSVAGHDSIKELEKIVKRGEYVLQLAAVCSRLETEREKIIPFGHQKRDAFEQSEKELKEPPPEIKDGALENWFNMEQFWIRVNNARLDVACLKEEKSFLENDNDHLKAQLKDYLTRVTIATGSNGNIEDRLMSRPSSMKVEKVVRIDLNTNKPTTALGIPGGIKRRPKRRPFTCIEANLSNAVRSVKMIENKMKTAKIERIVNW